jgi:hypothetical protein
LSRKQRRHITLKEHEGRYTEKGGAGGMVEPSEVDTVVGDEGAEQGVDDEGEVEGGVVGGVDRVRDDGVAGAGTGEVSSDEDISRGFEVWAVVGEKGA